ncbi:MAG: Enamine/imine deaminase [bacterium ADurb.Bin157]|jgi:2-iminobutanoate/2-iminopropanoate deaminase|nr:RidA family protein [bacterium]NLV94182.1 RidA family protein [Candidatus Riflebacteria bacterium]OQB50563.1 MAG: Enamine/imine deaminase [bacterium ADurb.Bin157]
MRQVIFTDKAPAAIGPYSQAIKINGLVYTSGQVPVNPETKKIDSEDIEIQAKQVMKNLDAVLKAANTDLSRVVKSTIFLKDLNDFAKVNEIYGSFFKSEPPARSCVQVAKLPLDCKIEIEVIALAD